MNSIRQNQVARAFGGEVRDAAVDAGTTRVMDRVFNPKAAPAPEPEAPPQRFTTPLMAALRPINPFL